MVGIRAVKLQLRLQRHAVGQSPLQTFIYRVARRINVVIQELQHEIVACVGYWEILSKHLVETLVLAVLRRRVKLQKITEGFQLHFEKIRKRKRILHRSEAYARFFG